MHPRQTTHIKLPILTFRAKRKIVELALLQKAFGTATCAARPRWDFVEESKGLGAN
jgi:hypothetical protein